MEHQDFKPVVFNAPKSNTKKPIDNTSKKTNTESKIIAPPKLGQIILQSRTSLNKTRKQFAIELNISEQILSRWETNREIPTNLQIALMEKKLSVKLPRTKKIKEKE